MSAFILCESGKAGIPYIFRPEGIGVYTMEELCYYLHKNIYFLNKDMIGQNLFSWIESELKLTRLASALRKEAIEKKSIFSLAVTIMDHSHLYTDAELEEIKTLIGSLENKTEIERRMICADTLLLKQNYREALYFYIDLLKEENRPLMTEETQSMICEHAAYVYTVMYCFPEAINLLKRSLELTHSEDTKHALYYLSRLADEWKQKYETIENCFTVDERFDLKGSFELALNRYERVAM